jgi:hypothetical protein
MQRQDVLINHPGFIKKRSAQRWRLHGGADSPAEEEEDDEEDEEEPVGATSGLSQDGYGYYSCAMH